MIRSSLAAVLALTLPAMAMAQETAPDAEVETPAAEETFLLELNNAATLEGNVCQLTYVATNGSAEDLSQASYQVGFFDAEGIVRRILVLDFGALPPGKTRIVPFNLPDQACEDISRIVVNDVAECTLADGGGSDVCGRILVASSRTVIQFGL